MAADAETLIREIVGVFAAGAWRDEWVPTVARAKTLALAHPAAVERLAAECIGRRVDAMTVLDAALSWLPAGRWPTLVARAVPALVDDAGNRAARAVVEYASLQQPDAVHPHLEPLLRLPYYHDFPYRNEPFRHAPAAATAFLLPMIRHGAADARRRASYALLESRRPDAFAFVAEHAPEHLDYLPAIGFAGHAGAFRQLYPDACFHLGFPAAYRDRMAVSTSGNNWDRVHPTWVRASSPAPTQRFGGVTGATCDTCGERVMHILTLAPVPGGLGVTGLDQLELGTCFPCLARVETPAYQHDATGRPHPIRLARARPPTSAPGAMLVETAIALADLGPRWRWQDWGATNGRENLTRVGGFPAWVQHAQHPVCPQCDRTMTFLMQFDVEDELPTTDGGQFYLGDGLCYAFWCDRCRVSAYRVQST